MIEDHEAPGGDQLAAAASEAQAALKTGWREASYNAIENERARQQRRYVRSCPVCASPIYADPGICTSCAFFQTSDAKPPEESASGTPQPETADSSNPEVQP